jgi:hypothetical protein
MKTRTTSARSTPQGEKLRRELGLMTPQELAAMLEISEYTLNGWRQTTPPTGPVFVYLGRKTYYRKLDVLSWIDDGLVRADYADKAAKNP